MFTSKQYVHHHRKGSRETPRAQPTFPHLNYRSSYLREPRTTFAYRFHMRQYTAALPPSPCPFPLLVPFRVQMQIQSILNIFLGARSQIVWNNHENVYMSACLLLLAVCRLPFAGGLLHFWRALKYAAPKI